MSIILQTFLKFAKNGYVVGAIILILLITYHLYSISSLEKKIALQNIELNNKENVISRYKDTIIENNATINNLESEAKDSRSRVNYIVSQKDSEIGELKQFILKKPKIQYITKTEIIYPECKLEIYKGGDINATNVIFNTIKSIGF